MKSKIFISINSILSFAEVSTNMTDKLIFTEDRGGVHPGPTHFRDFAPMPFWKLMVLLKIGIWNAYLFHFLAWLPPHV